MQCLGKVFLYRSYGQLFWPGNSKGVGVVVACEQSLLIKISCERIRAGECPNPLVADLIGSLVAGYCCWFTLGEETETLKGGGG